MKMLLRKNFYDTALHEVAIERSRFLDLIRHPIVNPTKEDIPLGIYGKLVASPMPNSDNSGPHYCADNVDSIYMLQLDYDSGISIDEWCETHWQYKYVIYTSHSHGYKGGSDRFRVILPLSEPLKTSQMGRFFKSAMAKIWQCDASCFDRAHCQVIPAIRTADSPYRYVIHSEGQPYTIPWDAVETERRLAQQVKDFDSAVLDYNAQWDTREPIEPDEEEIRRRQLRWAENRLMEATEGCRNSTAFSVLCYLKSNGFDAYDAQGLSYALDADFQGEFERMIMRMF